MALFWRQLTRFSRKSDISNPTNSIVRPPRKPILVKSRTNHKKLHYIPAYVLVVDESSSTSRSMRVAFNQVTTRINVIQLAAKRYLQHLKSSNYRQLVGVVGFSDTAVLYHSLASVGPNMSSLSIALKGLHPKNMTNLSAGLDLAISQLRRVSTVRGNIILITDGAANMELHRLPKLTEQAKSLNIRIFTIGVGNNNDSDYDRNLLLKTARCTGGRFMSAHSFETLCNALRKVG